MYFDRKQTEALGVDIQPDVNREGNELVTDLVDFTAQGLQPAADPVSRALLSLLSPRCEVHGHLRGRNQPPNPNTRLLLGLWAPLTPATTTWGGFQDSQGPLCALPAPPRVPPPRGGAGKHSLSEASRDALQNPRPKERVRESVCQRKEVCCRSLIVLR